MPTTNINSRVKRIAGLTYPDCTALENEGIITEEDLQFLEFVDLPATIPVVKRRKLNLIIQYLATGTALTATIDIDGVQKLVRAPAAQFIGTSGVLAVDPNRGAPKVHNNHLPKFSGDAIEYEKWYIKSGTNIKQYV